MTALSVAPSLLTLADIAELAYVQRPVVSMWRSRSAGTAHPFPAVAERLDSREAFRLDDVVSWLEQTGRGNNSAARQDAVASTALDLLPVADRAVAVEGLLALLALKAQLGTPLAGLSADDLADLADDVDPHDRCLYREIAALGGDVTTWAHHADALASASYTPRAAATSLLGRHHRLGLAAVSSQTFAPVVLGLAGRVAVELSAGGSRDFAVPDGDADLLLAITAADEEPGSVSVPVSDEPAARRARRMLLAGGWDVIDAVEDDDLVVPAPGSVVLVRMPSATRPGMSDAGVVDALGAIEATLPADGRAVVVGPASALCARLPTALQSARATVLRSGRVHAIVRLPARQWPAHPRQELGLWILAPRRPKVASG
ncbi:MAG: hypothetical protein KJ548_09710, partial [Actinobacteria bacterium]|nr:hypothetical protein [Actinomycetota bacterium]